MNEDFYSHVDEDQEPIEYQELRATHAAYIARSDEANHDDIARD